MTQPLIEKRARRSSLYKRADANRIETSKNIWPPVHIPVGQDASWKAPSRSQPVPAAVRLRLLWFSSRVVRMCLHGAKAKQGVRLARPSEQRSTAFSAHAETAFWWECLCVVVNIHFPFHPCHSQPALKKSPQVCLSLRFNKAAVCVKRHQLIISAFIED